MVQRVRNAGNRLFVKGCMKLQNAGKRFREEERGATHLVEIIVVIIIVIGIAAIFRAQLTEFVTKVMEDLLNF